MSKWFPDNWSNTEMKQPGAVNCLPECCMTVAAFLTSSWDRPSVTTTSTLGTPRLMPLSQVKTFSLINVRALPAKCTINKESFILSKREVFFYFVRAIVTELKHNRKIYFFSRAILGQLCSFWKYFILKKYNYSPELPVLVFPPLYWIFWRAPRAWALSSNVFSLNSDFASSLYCTNETWNGI